MKNLTKKYIEKKYNCSLDKITGFEDPHKFWVATENESDSQKFIYADDWDLSELLENIKEIIEKK